MVTQEAAERLLDTPRLRSDMTHLSKPLGVGAHQQTGYYTPDTLLTRESKGEENTRFKQKIT